MYESEFIFEIQSGGRSTTEFFDCVRFYTCLDPDDEFVQVVETSVNVTTNIPSQDYTHPENLTSPTNDTTYGSKPFTKIQPAQIFIFILGPPSPKRPCAPRLLLMNFV